ncbi:MAG: type II toxin-antitoxin system VapC family toxin [Planctomycetes bacterium]|nr:type II toxin-antitoxin system VapC family toxin [Planctomycetota bacterium]
MTFALDSSAALKWVLPEAYSDKAIRLRDDFHNGVIDLVAPDILPVESLHALTKAERQKRIVYGTAQALWQSILADCPVLHPHIPLLDRAYEIASSERIGIYDCIHVALAERETCELVTADGKLINNLQAKFRFIRHLSTFP